MKTAVIGSGAMGIGITQVLADAGCEVQVYDADPSALEKAGRQLHQTYRRLVEKGKLSAALADSRWKAIRWMSSLSGLSDAGLVIEAVAEDLAVKQQLFRQLEQLVEQDAILASNTSSLSLTAIASACHRPERVIGLHFFNPAPLMALVEIIPALQTDPGLPGRLRSLAASWQKVPVMAKDTPGFIVNRVARPFYGEALRILDEGIADCITIDTAMTTCGGFKMGPFALMDLIGNDVNYRVTETVFRALFYDPRYKPSLTQQRLFEAGHYGQKSGRGFYVYDGSVPPLPIADPALQQSIFRRILAMLVNEAAEALLFNVAGREDLETAMTRGVNYPKGLLRWAGEWGLPQVQEEMDRLYHHYHEDRYRCSALIRYHVQHQTNFL